MASVEAVVAAVDALEEELVDLTARLIQTPSINPALDAGGGEAAAGGVVVAALADHGLAVETVAADPERPNVVGVLRGTGGGRSLVLNGHLDTVGLGDASAWTVDPWGGGVHDGCVWGRGATDMKGGVAAMVIAAGALSRVGAELAGDLIVQAVIGEETGDPAGVQAVLERGFIADGAINGEPSAELGAGRDLAVHPVSCGALLFEVTLDGRSTHASLRHEWVHPSRRPHIGVNALEHGVELVAALQRLERRWAVTKRHPLFPPGKFVLHPGYFHSGPAQGDGPYFPTESCVVKYIVYHHPDDTAEALQHEIAEAIAAWAREDAWLADHPPAVEWTGAYAPFSLDPEHVLAGAVVRAHRAVTGTAARVTGFAAGSDATWLQAAGIPTLIYGPGELSVAHSIDEHVPVAELVQAAKVYAVAALDWCGETHEESR